MSELQKSLEARFLSPSQTQKVIGSNPEVQAILGEYGPLEKYALPHHLSELVNITLISQQQEVPQTSNNLIKASNQNYWASVALQELAVLSSDWQSVVQRIAEIMYGITPITPGGEEAQRLMMQSLELGDKAVEAQDFRDDKIKYIISSYVKGVSQEGIDLKTQPLLIRFMNKMIGSKGIFAAMDFFDEHLIDGMLDHPFFYRGFTFTDPYIVKRNDLFLPLRTHYRGDSTRHVDQPTMGRYYALDVKNPEAQLRVAKTFANFSLRAFVDKKFIYRYPEPRAPWLDARDCCEDVMQITGKTGDGLAEKLRELGFEEIIIKAYIQKDFDGRSVGGISSETALKVIPREPDLGQRMESSLRPSEIREALEVFEFPDLPSELELRRKFTEQIHIWHHDISGLPNAEEKERQIIEAYNLLKDHIKN